MTEYQEPDKIPGHIAIIMDGNGRWAKRQNLPRVEGHKQGVQTVRTIVELAAKKGIKFLTIYAFSTENWKRPEEEVQAIMNLLVSAIQQYVPELLENNVRLKYMGDFSNLSEDILTAMNASEYKTQHCDKMQLNVALSYGSRHEIINAVKQISMKVLSGEIKPEEINEKTIQQHFYLPELPNPDLLIRTSGEYRLSNYLLYQIAYTEIFFTEKCWPEFDEEEFNKALAEYARRERRFGKISEQL